MPSSTILDRVRAWALVRPNRLFRHVAACAEWVAGRSSKKIIVATAALGVLAVAAVLIEDYWEWLRTTTRETESGTETVRNLFLVFGGALALGLALWRSWVAHRQAGIAQRGLLIERFHKGAEMLGNRNRSVKLGGFHALRSLADEHPDDYHEAVMEVLISYMRDASGDREI